MIWKSYQLRTPKAWTLNLATNGYIHLYMYEQFVTKKLDHIYIYICIYIYMYIYLLQIRHGGPNNFETWPSMAMYIPTCACIYPHVLLSLLFWFPALTDMFIMFLWLIRTCHTRPICVQQFDTPLSSWSVMGWFLALFGTTCLGRSYNFVSLELTDFTCFLLLQLPCMCLRFPRHIVGIIFSKYGSKECTPESETSNPKITKLKSKIIFQSFVLGSMLIFPGVSLPRFFFESTSQQKHIQHLF